MIHNRKFWSISTISAVILAVLIPTTSKAAVTPSVSIGALTGASVTDGIVTGDSAAGVPITLSGFSGASTVAATLSLGDNGGSLTVDNTGAGASIALQPGYTSWTNVKSISIRGTVADVTTLLASKVSWNAPMNAEANALSVQVTEFPSGGVYNPWTGHYYKVVTSANAISFSSANTAASSSTFNGLQGYLATVTSQREQDFITSLGATDAWIGASDATTEGSWEWITGPEAGSLFWTGDGSGTPEDETFTYWALNEPNNYFNEDYLTFGKWGDEQGRWNDYSASNLATKSYVVEYGGMADDDWTGVSATTSANLSASNPITLGTTTSDVYTPGFVRYAASTAVPFAVGLTRFTNSTSTNFSAVISIPANTGTITISPTTNLSLLSGYSSFSAQTAIGFTGTKANVVAALKNRLVWNAPATYANLTPTITVGEIDTDYYLNPSNGHYYKIVDPGGNPDWTDAKTAAEALTYKGMSGYLATITDQSEQDFTKNNLPSNNMWLGATDDENFVNVRAQITRSNQEGRWHWVTGPEAGTEFWTGNFSGSAVNGMFTGWRSGEPNNSSYSCPWYGCGSGQQAYGSEDYMFTNVSGYLGEWNDVSNNTNSSNSYLVEFGGMPNEVSTAKATTQELINGALPDAPTSISATVKTRTLTNTGVATVSWNAPVSDGNRTITSYTVVATPSGYTGANPGYRTCQTSSTAPTAAATTCDVSGLSAFTNYTFTVKATNAFGDSSASSASSALDLTTPATNPGAPTDVTTSVKTYTLGTDGAATISWTAPASNGNRTIIGYTVTSTPEGLTCSTSSTAPSTPATSCDVSGLSAFTNYTFKVKADNGSYESASSTASSALDVTSIAGTPGAPTGVVANVKTSTLTDTGVATVAWSAPSNNGNRTIVKYTVTASPGGATCETTSVAPSTPAVSCEISGLSAWTEYTFTVTADNGNYTSDASNASSGITLTTGATTPGAPTGVTATVKSRTLTNDGEATVSWTEPANKGNRLEITGYTVTSSPGGLTCSTSATRPSSAATTCDVTGLSAWTNYTFTVKANNGSYSSAASSASSAVTLTTEATTPGEPTDVSATVKTRTLASNGAVTVSWTAPIDKGNRLQITGYTVTASPGGKTCTTSATRPNEAATTCDVTGLSAWTDYTFTVKANNGSYTSAESASTVAVDVTTLPAAPNAPRTVTATAKTRTLTDDGVATVRWLAPSANGYRTITKYTVTANPGGQTCETTSISPATPELTCDVSGLSAFTTYTFTVVANNGYFDSEASAASAGTGVTTLATTPDAPINVSASASTRTMLKSGVATVSWDAPPFNGNRTIVKYIVTATPSGKTCTTTSTAPATPATTCDIAGLSAFTDYTFKVKAENSSAYQSALSEASAVLDVTTLPIAPGAPTNVTATLKTTSIANDGEATISWTAPTFNGYRTITGYTVTSSPGGLTCSTTSTAPATPATTCDVSGLSGFTEYTFTVTATNSYVTSDASDASAGLDITTPPATPVAPSDVVASATTRTLINDGVATVSWTAPADTGYRTIIGYTVTASPGGATCSSDSVDGIAAAATTCDVTGLNAFTEYTFTVTAGNGYFQSAASEASDELDVTTLPAAPGAVTNVTATLLRGTTSNTGEVSVSWTEPADTGNRAITGYTVSSVPFGLSCTTTGATSCVVEGLIAGIDYTFTVLADNGFYTGASAGTIDPLSVLMPPTAPVAPTGIQASVNADNEVTVTWNVPTDIGSSAITGYSVTASPGGETCESTGALTCTFTTLTPGVDYTFTVAANNGDGLTSSESTSSVSVDPATSTSAPTAPAITAVAVNGSGVVTVDWSAPTDAGSSAVTSYTVTASPGGATCTVTAPSTSCSSWSPVLTPGVDYTFTVVAANGNGDSVSSSVSGASVDPGTVTSTPGTPTGVQSSVAPDGTVLVSWTAPTSTGSTSLQAYTVTANPGGATCIVLAPATSCSSWNPALDASTEYSFSVAASNLNGSSPASDSSVGVNPSTPTSAPGPVTDLQVAVFGNQTVTVTWNAPASSGSSDITGYTVVASPGGATCVTTSTLACDFTSLTPGTEYSFSVTVNNGNGGTASSSAAPVNPAVRTEAPGAPTAIQASTGSDGLVTVSWSAPTNLGSPAVSSYTVTASPGGATCSVLAPATACSSWTQALESGTEYTFSVEASNGNQTSEPSMDSVSVDPAVESTAPSAPQSPEVSVGIGGAVTVTWSAPAEDGSSALTGYLVTATPGGATCSTTGPRTCTFTGLNAGTQYQFTVSARNGNLYSVDSNQTATVDPAVRTTLPRAPFIVAAKFGNASATLTLRAPVSTGGVPLSRYEYTINGGTTWVKLNEGSVPNTWTIANLTNGTKYLVKVRSVNPVGTSGASNTKAVIPHTAPDAPTLVSLTSQGTVVNANFLAPANNGGERVDYYAYSLNGGATWISWGRYATPPELVRGLKLNMTYTIVVRARNSAGWSPASNALQVTTKK